MYASGRTFTEMDDSYYLIYDQLGSASEVNERKSWEGARDACRAEGYELVTINDPDEDEFVGSFITNP